MNRISVIVVGHGRPDLTQTTLESFARGCERPDLLDVMLVLPGGAPQTPSEQGKYDGVVNWIRRQFCGSCVITTHDKTSEHEVRGNYLLVIEEGVRMLTSHWDAVLRNKIDPMSPIHVSHHTVLNGLAPQFHVILKDDEEIVSVELPEIDLNADLVPTVDDLLPELPKGPNLYWDEHIGQGIPPGTPEQPSPSPEPRA